ncbi:MAG: KH domain-containing protein [Oscillospiraceae bacterium]
MLAIVRGHVDNPDAVRVEVDESNPRETVYHIIAAEEDKGRIIGQRGTKARAIRTVAGSIASKQVKRVRIEID